MVFFLFPLFTDQAVSFCAQRRMTIMWRKDK